MEINKRNNSNTRHISNRIHNEFRLMTAPNGIYRMHNINEFTGITNRCISLSHQLDMHLLNRLSIMPYTN